MRELETRNPECEASAKRIAGFTIIEMLVVAAILVIIASIAVVAIGRARRASRIAATQSFMQALVVGLDGFKRDHDFLPPSSLDTQSSPSPHAGSFMYDTADPWYGAEIIAQSLMGYAQNDDNPPLALDPKIAANKPGYGGKKLQRSNYEYAKSGRDVGPYVELQSPDHLIKTYEDSGTDVTDRYAFTQPSGYRQVPILYYRRERNPNQTWPMEALWGQNTGTNRYAYNILDNHKLSSRSSGKMPPMPQGESDADPFVRGKSDKAFEYLQSQWDARNTDTGNSPSDPDWPKHDSLNGLETSLKGADYVLMAPGPDEEFGGTVGGDTEYDDIVITGN